MIIRVYDDINESHAATGYHGRTNLPNFHIFTVEDTYPSTRQVMQPYRFNFYQVVMLEHSSDATLNTNTQTISDLNNSLSFASPEHVLAWVRGEAQRGFILYFKDDFLVPYLMDVQHEFPFFRLSELNWLRFGKDEQPTLRDHFTRIMARYNTAHPYRLKMLQSQVLNLLYECKYLHDEQQNNLTQQPTKHALIFRFQQFINQYYLTHKTVEAYANLLNITPDYLGQTVKAVTGKTAHRLIQERVLLEAKELLTYSDLNVAEIADFLGYSEPTHFGRFFRRAFGVSPLVWRQQQG